MESQNLQAASTYVNNILLARGLLKGGRAIEFADPENEDGGTDGTMARVINLVNDLVLRRDREAEHRESLSTTIRTLQATETEQTAEIGKLRTKTSELTRSVALAEAQERALKTNVTNAETTIRGLKEQVQRMKSTVSQVRAQCANDIRKRDLEMQKLKSHLADRQRGKREGLGVTTININPAADRSRLGASGGDRINDPGYSLKQETTDFLTELCQNLSDENDTLIELARNTVHTLKDLQGLPQAEATPESEQNGMGASVAQKPGPVTSLPTSCEELSCHMETVLDHLRTLLTNPSFVPLEEVEVREEEIKRLREGWVKMEGRWKQAVTMMGGWQRRLADGGDSIQAEELKHGMNLDLSINSPEETSIQSAGSNPIPTILEDQDEEQDLRNAEQHTEQKAPEPEISNPRTRSKIRKVPERLDRVLRERNDNSMAKRPRKVSFTPGLQGSPAVENVDDETLEIKAYKTESVTRRPSRRKTQSKEAPQESLSVQQKLAAVEDEARAAQNEQKERESRKRSHPDKASRPPNRRRSTLTTDELGDLMGVAR
ncbi:unnamed protein product [Penicillium salamii]|uniref:NIMA interactive protein n=1 Tax=Penicillium salamii TaxID=1612424 RepID=A0A9W4K5M4_9EURO|nr:unnamed protein product [Penicillium salamii]CAG8230326.1 unnamed protein product [Penicillium salamii]CAG8246164.1 unnamed protein product [Penicillium salamii]CAG8303892.1 unnamed protein product [Penicillium salamii]CAG8325682.1 unnamed protein product [Penicillium salamii]